MTKLCPADDTAVRGAASPITKLGPLDGTVVGGAASPITKLCPDDGTTVELLSSTTKDEAATLAVLEPTGSCGSAVGGVGGSGFDLNVSRRSTTGVVSPSSMTKL
jgi:hypothetical protein